MKLRVCKWGNGLALRLPQELVRRAGLKAGDTVQVSLTEDGALTIRTEPWDRRAFSEKLARARDSMQMSDSVIEELRNEARY
ncbi:MAG: AbrB/MazE/SpoVT family DNA-binding domain-containing protein [Gammaproteobacteria bacterium]|nr:AbrB/MazE/SpoVT family DNA-binding domain-containing protein [Gammaproteobacteria bacterium]